MPEQTSKSVFKDFKTLGKLIDDHPVNEKYGKWEENWLFFRGEQWWTRKGRKLNNQFEKLRKRDNFTYLNKIFVTVNIWGSKFVEKLIPVFAMLPQNTTQEARQKSRVSKQYAKFWWHMSKFRKKTLPYLVHFFCTGNMFSKTFFDPKAYAEVDIEGKVETLQVGEVCFEYIHPRAMFYDPYASSIDDEKCRWTIELAYLPKTEIFRLYEKKVEKGREKLPKWADDPLVLFKEHHWDLRKYEDEGVLRIITFEREEDFTWTEKVWVGEKVIHTVKGHKCNPYNQAKDQDLGNIGEPKLEHGIQPQRDINKLHTMFLDTMQHVLGFLFVDGDIPKTSRTGGGLTIVQNEGGLAPVYHPGPQISNALPQAMQMENSNFDDAMSTHEHLKGKVPAGSSHMPGYIHQSLLGQDLARLGAAMVEFEEMTGHILMKAINLAVEFYTEERMLRVMGDEDIYSMLKLKGDRLGVADVRVDFGSSLPITKMEKIQLLREFVQMGIIPPEKFLENVDVGHIEKGLSDTVADANRIRRQIDLIYDLSFGIIYDPVDNTFYQEDDSPGGRALRTSETLTPHPFAWDNPMLQVPILETEMKGQKYENSDEFTKEMLQLYRQRLLILAGQAPQEVIPSGGANPPQGEPAPPSNPEEMVSQLILALFKGTSPEELVAQGAPEQFVVMIAQLLQQNAPQIEAITTGGGGEQDVITLILPMVMQILAEEQARIEAEQLAAQQSGGQVPPQGV